MAGGRAAHACSNDWPLLLKSPSCYEYDRQHGFLWISHWFWGSALALSIGERSKDNHWTDNKRVSFWCQLQLSLPDRSRTESGRQTPNAGFFTECQSCFVSGRCLQIADHSELRAGDWIINHNGTINTLFSQVLLILKMSKADGTLPAGTTLAKSEERVEWKGKTRKEAR